MPLLFRRRIRDFAGRQVTGAASGIGRAVALALAQEGAVLHLTDIDGTGLSETAQAAKDLGAAVPTATALDVTDADAVRRFGEAVTEEHGPMDVVMNVAGIAIWGTVSSLEHQQWKQVVDVNLMGPIHVIEAFLPPMVDGGRGGHLVNVSSAAGLIGMPWHAAYSASKFGLRGVSEVLRFDLRKHGIGVSLVCPGGVDTGLTETIQIAGVDSRSRRFRRAQAGFRRRAVSPGHAAESILRGVRRNRYWVYTSNDIRAAHALQRLFPPGYVALMRGFNLAANRVLPQVEAARRPERVLGARDAV
jgi:NAD(P)-dependent dehydrogenase (short-subunit alcohol dehydrogenase family)